MLYKTEIIRNLRKFYIPLFTNSELDRYQNSIMGVNLFVLFVLTLKRDGKHSYFRWSKNSYGGASAAADSLTYWRK